MIRLTKAINAWGSADFITILKEEIERMDSEQLPLQQGLSTSSYATSNTLNTMILSVTEEEDFIRAKAGLFYTGIISGCSCADDPTPVHEQAEYCEVQLDIDKTTAETTVVIVLPAPGAHT